MLIIPANSASASGGYQVANSVRMETNTYWSGSNKVTATSNKVGSFSFWIKRTGSGSNAGGIVKVYDDANTGTYIGFTDADKFFVEEKNAGGTAIVNLITDAVYRDQAAWYHILVTFKTDDGTDTNRVKLFINGVQPSLGTATYPSVNTDLLVLGSANPKHEIGVNAGGASGKHYITQLLHVDGTALANTDVGEFDSDSGIWKPIDISETTLGNNGYYLAMEDSSNFGIATGKAFTANNQVATDQATDTPTNNFITLNPLIGYTSQTDNQVYSEGNTIIIPNSTDNYGTGFSTIGLKGGKWYWEAQIVWNGTSNNANFPRTIGFCTENYLFNYSYLGQDEESWGIIFADAATDIWRLEHGGSSGDISGATTMANGGTMNLALDLDNGKFYVGYNGTFFTSGDPTSGATGTGAIATLDATDLSKYIFPAVTNATNSTYYKFNFGNPAFAISSGNTDGNSRGNFEYLPPSGYLSLCTANLSEVLS